MIDGDHIISSEMIYWAQTYLYWFVSIWTKPISDFLSWRQRTTSECESNIYSALRIFKWGVQIPALTSANTKGTSYINPTWPFLTASTDAGPHWKNPFCRKEKEKIDRVCRVIYRHTVVVLTGRKFLRSGIYGLPAPITFRQIRPTHPTLHPNVKVPNRILAAIGIEGIVVKFVVFRVIISIYSERSIRVVSANKVGNWSRWNAQCPAHWNRLIKM